METKNMHKAQLGKQQLDEHSAEKQEERCRTLH